MKQRLGFAKDLQWAVAIYAALCGVALMTSNHGDIVLWLNERHSPALDLFFKYATYLGDGVMLGVVALIVLFWNYHRFLIMLIAIALQTAFVHIFKQWLAAGEPRPKTFFADRLDDLNFVEGVKVNAFDSFPSGHTASAFTLAFFLILITKNRMLQHFIFILAVLIGISRVYLLQHFLLDIYIGSVFGILSVLIAWNYMKRFEDRPNLQPGLLKK